MDILVSLIVLFMDLSILFKVGIMSCVGNCLKKWGKLLIFSGFMLVVFELLAKNSQLVELYSVRSSIFPSVIL